MQAGDVITYEKAPLTTIGALYNMKIVKKNFRVFHVTARFCACG